MVSRRIKVLRKICDALDAPGLFPGGCKKWEQRGIDSEQMPYATVVIESDRPINQTTGRAIDGGDARGRYDRELILVIEVSMGHDDDDVTSTHEQVDVELVKAENAVSSIDWTGVLDDERFQDFSILETRYFRTIDDAPLNGGTVRARFGYAHAWDDPAVA